MTPASQLPDASFPAEGNDPYLGRVIAGKFEIRERIAQGAMGVVYRAQHATLDVPLALKVLHPHLTSDEQFSRRFEREAKIACSFVHANSVRVFDCGTEPDGTLYLAMELVDGRDLWTILEQEGRMAPARAVHLLLQVLSALGAAHAVGVVHRDIKPENVLVVRGEDDNGDPIEVAKVCDFGIASIAAVGPGAKSSRLTMAGLVVGTPTYMSPEQARGEETDARSDLYSLGVVLYQILTGNAPFDADTPLAVVLKHLTEQPPPPEQFYPGVHRRVAAVALKAMAKSPADRYQTAREMRAALRAASDWEEDLPLPSVVPGGDVAIRVNRGPDRKNPLATDGAAPVANQGTLTSAHSVGAMPVSPRPRDSTETVKELVATRLPTSPPLVMANPGAVPAFGANPSRGRGLALAAGALAILALAVAVPRFLHGSPAGGAVAAAAATDGATGAPVPTPAGDIATIASRPFARTAEPAPREVLEIDPPGGPAPAGSLPRNAPPPFAMARSIAKAPVAATAAKPDVASVAKPDVADPAVAAPLPVVPPPPAAAEPISPPVVAVKPTTPEPVAPTATAEAPVRSPDHARVNVGVVAGERGVTPRSVQAGLAGALPRITACYRAAFAGTPGSGTGNLHLETDGDGVVVSAVARLPIAPLAAHCVERAVVGVQLAGVDTGEASADVSMSFHDE